MIFTSFYKLIFYFQQNGGKLISVDYIYNKVKLRNNHFNCRYVVELHATLSPGLSRGSQTLALILASANTILLLYKHSRKLVHCTM